VKSSLPFISSPLAHICNAVLGHIEFPDRVKYATVKPCFRKGNRQEMTSYRPILLLSTFSKVFERLIYDRLITHVRNTSILVHEQNEFRTYSSTEKGCLYINS
jgi:hypothetical protein